MKRVIVTGGAGFIGRNLVAELNPGRAAGDSSSHGVFELLWVRNMGRRNDIQPAH